MMATTPRQDAIAEAFRRLTAAIAGGEAISEQSKKRALETIEHVRHELEDDQSRKSIPDLPRGWTQDD